MVGIISLVVLAITIVIRYPLRLAWRKTRDCGMCGVVL
jgi:hypothetical protein